MKMKADRWSSRRGLMRPRMYFFSRLVCSYSDPYFYLKLGRDRVLLLSPKIMKTTAENRVRRKRTKTERREERTSEGISKEN